MDTNIETFEPSGSNDELFFRTMSGVEHRLQNRARTYRRRVVTGMITSIAVTLFILVGLAFVLGPFP